MRGRRRNKLRAAVILGVVVMLAGAYGTRAGARPAEQRELKEYRLPEKARAADMSPDEKYVAMEVSRKEQASDGQGWKMTELAQLWDFREDRQVASTELEETDGRYIGGRRLVRFTGDGQLAVFYVDGTAFVLAGDNLRILRKINVNAPEERTITLHLARKNFVTHGRSELTGLDVSSTHHWMALVWACGLASDLEIYDLDAGVKLKSWNTGDLGMGHIGAAELEWGPNGRDLVVVTSCDVCDTSDVFMVDALSGVIRNKFTVHFPAKIAVANGEVWAVADVRKGVVKDRRPAMVVFNLDGKKMEKIAGRESGVRYAVAASADGKRVAAFTGIIKMNFEWGDGVWGNQILEETFTVWDATSGKELVTSRGVKGRIYGVWGFEREAMRMSAKGNFVMYGEGVWEVGE